MTFSGMKELKYKPNDNLKCSHPELVQEWHPVNNGNLDPEAVSAGSHKKIWWLGKCGHEWQATIANRTYRGDGCPYCSGRRVLGGYNDLATTNPELLAEWNYEKNKDFIPSDVKAGSNKKVWWKCEHNHEWEARISDRARGKSCPYCSGRVAISGDNDLTVTHPALAEEWHPVKNKKLKPMEVKAGSQKKVWWLGKCGHEWTAVISSRAIGKIGCPYCTNQKVLAGYNDLETTHPELAKEFHPIKNGSIKASSIVAGTRKELWWKCRKGHEWKSAGYSRVAGNGCPICATEMHTSFPEQAVLYYLSLTTQTENRHKAFDKEIDIWLPSLNVGVEYNGEYYHRNKELQDTLKVEYFKEKGIRIITIKEGLKNVQVGDIIEFECSTMDYKHLGWAIKLLLEELGLTVPIINIDADRQRIYSQYLQLEKENSLEATHPELITEWNYEKNGEVSPSVVSYGSTKKVWWICKSGHEWQAIIANRATKGRGCPYCAGQRVLEGYNDLSTTHPELAKEWHPIKNKNTDIKKVSSGMAKRVWWLGKCGHEWQASLNDRRNGNGCPYCAGQKILVGFNDLSTTHPELAAEWHPTMNGNLSPNDVSRGSTKKVWWICKNGHEWQATPNSRTNKSRGCAICALNKQKKDLIVKEWRKNNPNGSKAECARDTGLGKSTVARWWDIPTEDNTK